MSGKRFDARFAWELLRQPAALFGAEFEDPQSVAEKKSAATTNMFWSVLRLHQLRLHQPGTDDECANAGRRIALRNTSNEAAIPLIARLKRFAFNLIHKIEGETPTTLRGRGLFVILPDPGKMQKALGQIGCSFLNVLSRARVPRLYRAALAPIEGGE